MKFLIIGETCSDRFCYGKAPRLCPEAPVPVFVPDGEVESLGMTTNVISDYNKNFLKDRDLEEIGKRSKLSFLDTKKKYNSAWSRLFTFIKINEKEYLENGWKYMCDNLIVTKAARGCSYKDKDYPIKHPSEVRDVSGAGDTFLAAFAYSYTLTKKIDSSIVFAQNCCQTVIRKKGVATV